MKNKIIYIGIINNIKYFLYSLYLSMMTYAWNMVINLWETPAPLTSCIRGEVSNIHMLNKTFSDETHAYIKVQGVKFHYVEVGNKCKPLLILLHGFLDFWIGWRFQISALKEHFRIVAVDLKGCGDSEKPQWRRDYEVDVLVRELHDLVIALGEANCILIGHDIGASLGWYLAAFHPHLVTKFVAISSPHPNVYWEHIYSIKDKFFNARFIHLCQVAPIAKTELLRDNLKMLDYLYHHVSKTSASEIMNAYKFVFSRPKDLTGPVNYLRTLPLVRLDPGHITVPTMLIVGSKDPFVSVESIVKSTIYLKDFQIKLLEDAGRAPQQEHYTQVNELLTSFLCECADEVSEERIDSLGGGLIGNLVSNTFKYGNSIVDNVKKKTSNGVAWRPQILKSS